jgi:hypothetical protein
MSDPEPKEEFKVTDRRRFTTQGENMSAEEPRKEEPQQNEPEEPHQNAAQKQQRPSGAGESAPINFSGFVISLANSALYHLGLLKLPDGSIHKDLGAAKQTIDIIAIIEEKTKGNLTEEEAAILKETLFQLRMAFVEASK